LRMDLNHMPWPVVQGYFAPALLCAALVTWAFGRRPTPADVDPQAAPAAAATRATAALYGNAVQLGIPMAAAVFGEQGLAIHLALVSLHSILVLTLLTVLAEGALARQQAAGGLVATVRRMVVSSVLHPVVLPIALGLLGNLLGLRLPAVLDGVLAGLGLAVVPLCLLLIGMNLAQFGLRGNWRTALPQMGFKLLVLPAAVLAVAGGLMGLRGLPLQVAVMMAALPVGTNALIFAQRYRLLQAEATVAIVLSTCAFALTAPLWLAVVSRL
jgi:malonate transporter and related proteins